MTDRNGIYRADDESERIRRAQTWLRALWREDRRLIEVFIDGIYGSETQNAVTQFQLTRKLPITGEIDGVTFDRIFSDYTELLKRTSPLPFTPPFYEYAENKLSEGDVFDDIYLLQLLLRRLSVNDDRFFTEMTGVYDEKTAASVDLLRRVSTQSEGSGVDIPLWNNLIRLTESMDGYV